MLHVVQVVMWGVAETPQLFMDEEKAQAVYVECTKKYWEQRYSAYCEHHGVSSDSFASAQAFVNTIDASEKSRINYWTFNRKEAGLGESKNAPCGPGMEEFRNVAKEIVSVKERLTRLLDDVSNLADNLAGMDVSLVEVETVGGPGKTALSPSAAPQRKPERSPEAYTTPEWKTFAGTIKRLSSGSRNDFHLLSRDDWRQDVYSNLTSLEYWDWVADRLEKYKDEASDAGYSVVEDTDSRGCYKFTNREGITSENCYDSEWEAWCAAGLHVEANSRVAVG